MKVALQRWDVGYLWFFWEPRVRSWIAIPFRKWHLISKILTDSDFWIFAFFGQKSSKKAQKWRISNGRHFSACVLPIFYCCGFLEIWYQCRSTDFYQFLIFDFFHSQKKPQKSPKMKKFNFFSKMQVWHLFGNGMQSLEGWNRLIFIFGCFWAKNGPNAAQFGPKTAKTAKLAKLLQTVETG